MIVVTSVTREELLARAKLELRPGIRPHEAIVIAYAGLVDEPLDPERFDDAAVILRSVRLLVEGVPVAEAVATARTERITWGIG